jgi:hypothetical protein
MVKNESKCIEALKQSFSTTESLDSPRENAIKYKTELCRSWIEHNFCPYGEKCKFAHGKGEIQKYIPCKFYKLKDCKTFHSIGFCNYGPRCMFRHDERKLDKLERTYYGLILEKRMFMNRRLNVFEKIVSRTEDMNIITIRDEILTRLF